MSLKEIKSILHDDLFKGSKDWRSGDVVERVRYLVGLCESQKLELEVMSSTAVLFIELKQLIENIDKKIDFIKNDTYILGKLYSMISAIIKKGSDICFARNV